MQSPHTSIYYKAQKNVPYQAAFISRIHREEDTSSLKFLLEMVLYV